MLDRPITPGQMLRLTVAANAIQVPGAPSALAGRLIEELGYSAIYVARRTIAAGMLATCDECVLTLTELVQQVQYLTARVTVPVIVDAGTCAGDAANVRRAVTELERAGVAGIEFGDGCESKGDRAPLSKEDMNSKLRAACEARVDDQLILIARTNVRTADGLGEAVDRARSYLEAGAEWIAPEGLASQEQLAEFAKAIFELPHSKKKLQQILQLSDLVKFAKMLPIEAENEFTLQNAFDFVNGTKREEVIVIEEEQKPEDTETKNV
jgi:methylisocitrate lyase